MESSQHIFVLSRSATTNLEVHLEKVVMMINEDILYLNLAKTFTKVLYGRFMDNCKELGEEGRVLR